MHDDAAYVPRELYAEYLAKDPVERFRSWLQLQPRADRRRADAIDEDVRATVERGVAEAEASPLPDPATVLDGVYAAVDFSV